MKATKFLSMLLAVIMLFCTVASAESVQYVRGDDEEIYNAVLGDYAEMMAAA